MQDITLQLENVGGDLFRAHMNAIFDAFVTLNSGPTEPPATVPFLWWADTAAGLLKQRNAGNNGWVTIGPLDTPNFGRATIGANTFTAAQNFAGNLLQRSVLRDYAEKVNALGSISGNVAISTAAGSVVTATVASDVSFSFATTWPAGVASSLTLRLVNGGAHSVTWPAGTKWPGGVPPVLAPDGVDLLTFMTLDGGATWCGFSAVQREAPSSFPAVASVTPSTFTTSATSHDVAMPATVTAGDLLLAIVNNFSSSIITPADWTTKLHVGGSGAFGHLAAFGIFAKVADGTEAGGTVDFETVADSRSMAAQVIRVRNWHGDLSGVAVSAGAIGQSQKPNPDALAAPWGTGKTLWIAAAGALDDAAPFNLAPDGYAGLVSTVADRGANQSAAAGSAWREVEAETENAGPFGLPSSESWVAAMIGVRARS